MYSLSLSPIADGCCIVKHTVIIFSTDARFDSYFCHIFCVFSGLTFFSKDVMQRRHSWCDDNLTSFVWRRTFKMASVSLKWNWFSSRPPNYNVHIFYTHICQQPTPLRIHTRPSHVFKEREKKKTEIYKFLLYFLSLAASVCSSILRIESMFWEWVSEKGSERERGKQGRENGCCYTLLSMIQQHKIICIINKLFLWIRSRTSNRAQCFEASNSDPYYIYCTCAMSPNRCVRHGMDMF